MSVSADAFPKTSRMISLSLTGLLAIFSLSCRKSIHTGSIQIDDHLKYFGFTLVDVGWDDPLDGIEKTNYIDEVKSFSNLADLPVFSPDDDLLPGLDSMESAGLKVMLHLSEIFFQYSGTEAPSGAKYELRPDYQTRWNQLVQINHLTANKDKLLVFYLGEEPTWNGIAPDQLKAAADYIKSTIPDVPVLIVEASKALTNLQIPASVDWVGFDHYFIKDPKNDEDYLRELSLIKTKRSTPAQKIVLIMDAEYIPAVDMAAAGISETDMKGMATSYFDLALSDSSIIGMLGYCWPGGFDDPTAKGARDHPQSVQEEYRRIGKIISGK